MKILSTAILAATAFAALAPAQTLPAGPNKDLFEKACTSCHGLEPITIMKASKDEWNDVVEDMIAKGAEINKADQEKIVAYLAAAFPKDKKISLAPPTPAQPRRK